MGTVDNGVEVLRLNDALVWWLKQGTTVIGRYLKGESNEAAIKHFRQVADTQPPGTYKLVMSDRENNYNGGTTYTFKIADTEKSVPALPIHSGFSGSNLFGIPESTHSHIRAQVETGFMVKRIYDFVNVFEKEWDEYKEKIDKMEEFFIDADENGTPDFLEGMNKLSTMSKSVKEMKNLGFFSNK